MSGELQGRSFGGYQLVELIGEGGVGEVYRARHPAAPSDVAVKVIFREFARQPGFAQIFQAVTDHSQRLAKHAHVLPLIASGVDDEYYYLVSPYVREGSLAKWIASGGKLGLTDVAPFFAQLCSALSYVHSLNVVHGNLKPSNIYLYEGRHVLLGDFGLLWDTRNLDASWSGAGVESFEYFAPEIFKGQIAPTSDIYSAGATLFTILTGRAPYHFDRLADLMAASESGSPPTVASSGPASAPLAAFDAPIRQAMAGRLEDRFASAAMFSQVVDAAVRQGSLMQPLVAPPQNQQWQPLASTPMSAGTFSALPSPPGLFDGGWSGSQPGPGAFPGSGQPGLPPGIGQLGQLDPPFPPMPPMFGQDTPMGDMTAPMGEPPSSSLTDQPTMRAPSAPADMGWMGDPGQGMGQNFGLDAGQSDAMGRGPASGRMMRDSQRMAAVGYTPTGPTPAVTPEPASGSGAFSPTELGLPRLTNPAMAGNLPENWQELLNDDSARERHDPFTRSSASGGYAALAEDGELMPLTGVFALSSTQPRQPAQGKRDATASQPGSNAARSAPGAWSRSEPSRPWDAQANQADASAASGAFGGSQSRGGGSADFTVDGLADKASKRARLNDTLFDQRAWTNSFRIVRAKPHLSRNAPRIALLVAILLVEFIGITIARPDLCATPTCIDVALRIHRYVPGLVFPGAQAPLRLAPDTPTLSTTSNASATTTMTLTNIWAIPITWNASTQPAWVTVSPASGTIPPGGHAQIQVTASANGLAPGAYEGAIELNTSSGVAGAPVRLAVTSGPTLSATPSTLNFKTCGDTQTLSVTNTGGADLKYNAVPSQSAALEVSPGSGTVKAGQSAKVSVTLDCAATAGQQYAVMLISNGGSAQAFVAYNP